MIVMSLYLYARTSKCGSKRTNSRPVVEFFSAVEGMGLPGIQKAISQDGYMVSTLKDSISL